MTVVQTLYTMKNKYKLLIAGILILFLLLVFVLSWRSLSSLFLNLAGLREFVLRFGILAPIIMIILIILQVLIAPIPGQIVGFASGYIFGAVLGTVYSMVGIILGSFLAFVLARKLGRPFVEKFVSNRVLRKFDKLVQENGAFTLFLLFLIPGLPDDAICYLAGLTNIRIRKLVILAAIGRFPSFLIMSLAGAGVVSYNSLTSLILFLIVMIISVIVFMFRKNIEEVMIKLVKTF